MITPARLSAISAVLDRGPDAEQNNVMTAAVELLEEVRRLRAREDSARFFAERIVDFGDHERDCPIEANIANDLDAGTCMCVLGEAHDFLDSTGDSQ